MRHRASSIRGRRWWVWASLSYVSRKKTPSNQKLSKEACECVRVIITKYHGNRDSTKVTEAMIWHLLAVAVVFQTLSGTDVTDAKPNRSCYKFRFIPRTYTCPLHNFINIKHSGTRPIVDNYKRPVISRAWPYPLLRCMQCHPQVDWTSHAPKMSWWK